MEELIKILLVLVIGGATVISLLAAITLLLPIPVEKTRQYMETALGRSLLLGLVNTLFGGMIIIVCLWGADKAGGVVAAILVLIAGLLAAMLSVLILLGLCAVSGLLGMRIREWDSAFSTSLRGSLLLLLAGLTPYIGWFVFTPLVMLVGVGAAIQVVSKRKPKETATPISQSA